MGRYEIDFLVDYTDDALLAELRRIAALLPTGMPLTITAFEHLSPKVSHDTVSRRFGGWEEVLKRAGLGHLSGDYSARKLTDDQCFENLAAVWTHYGRSPKRNEMLLPPSVIQSKTYLTRWGTWRKAIKAFVNWANSDESAGLGNLSEGYPARELTNEQCFQNLAELWAHYGRPPQYREMFRPPSHIRGKTYITRWGTWRNALKAFADSTNSNGPPASDPQESPAVLREVIRVQTEADCREIRPGLRFKVFMRDRFRCLGCGRSLATYLNIELHADHVVSVADGGKTTLENLQTLCQDCNLGKGALQ
jgi:hypothetical protein